MITHLPALQVLLPLLSALLIVSVGTYKNTWWICLCAKGLGLVNACLIASVIILGGAWDYVMGGWKPHIGIEYRIDALGCFFLVLIAGIGLLLMPFTKISIESEIIPEKRPFFYSAWLLLTAGLNGMVLTNDLFNLYVFLEIAALASYALIAMGKNRGALLATYEYLIAGTVGATLILLGVGLIYMMTGTLNVSDIASRFACVSNSHVIQLGIASILIGIVLKLAMFPAHSWLIKSYTYAPTAVTALLSGTVGKVMLYILIKLTLVLLLPFGYLASMPIAQALTALAILGIIVASLLAFTENNVRSMLAYTSVVQVGYIVLAIVLFNESAYIAALIGIVQHALAKTALFVGIGAIAYQSNATFFSEFKGYGRVMPWTSAGITMAVLSYIGVPFTIGFVGKFALLSSITHEMYWIILIVIIFGSVMGILNMLKIIDALYLQKMPVKSVKKESPLMMRFTLYTLVGFMLMLGLWNEPMYALFHQAMTPFSLMLKQGG